ncbi:MAG TPA: amidase, partial [Actinomycetota bacterium]|nr:amidase [Actinomycetota bacterium]
MGPGRLVGRTAGELAALVRRGDASPVDVVAAHLARIEELEPTIRAFRRVRAEEALREAEALASRDGLADLPLPGIPVAVKENVAVAGEEVRHGSAATPAEPAPEDDEVVRRVRAAGGIVVGITRMPELGLWGTTDGPWGITRNPWDPRRSPGGSSGGNAAAVAAGAVPLALGNDGLGSIRIPAACCGVVGMKPGTGLLPPAASASAWAGFTEHGPFAVTVADAALLLSVLAGRADLRDLPLAGLPVAVGGEGVGQGEDRLRDLGIHPGHGERRPDAHRDPQRGRRGREVPELV